MGRINHSDTFNAIGGTFSPNETPEKLVLNKTMARKQGYNPVHSYSRSPWVVWGVELMEGEELHYFHPTCESCDECDVNNGDTYNIFNGNYLIEYPKRSMKFWCPLCFIWNHDRKTVNRIMGSDPNLPHHDENAADEWNGDGE